VTQPTFRILYDKGILARDCEIFGATLDTHIRKAIMEKFSPIICVHELDSESGNINILNITSIDYDLRPYITTSHQTMFTLGITPENDNSSPERNIVHHSTFSLRLRLNFTGKRDNYEVRNALGIQTPYVNAVLKITGLLDPYLAIRVCDGPALISFGRVWERSSDVERWRPRSEFH
jgi:hypothetical protein